MKRLLVVAMLLVGCAPAWRERAVARLWAAHSAMGHNALAHPEIYGTALQRRMWAKDPETFQYDCWLAADAAARERRSPSLATSLEVCDQTGCMCVADAWRVTR